VRGYWFLLLGWKLLRLPEGPLYTTINILAIDLPSYFTSSVSSYFEEGFREIPNEPHHAPHMDFSIVAPARVQGVPITKGYIELIRKSGKESNLTQPMESVYPMRVPDFLSNDIETHGASTISDPAMP